MRPTLRNIRIARVFGIPIEMSPSWFITLAFFILVLGGSIYPDVLDDEPAWLPWTLAGISGIFFCASVITHELAHSLVARRLGIPVRAITLFMLGGVSQISRDAGRPLLEFTMAIVGPLSSILLAGVFLGIAFLPGVRDGRSAVMWEWLFLMNLALGIVNMAPGFPMDGGRVLRAALWGITGNFRRATRWASLTGRGMGYALIGTGMLVFLGTIPGFDLLSGVWFILIGFFLDNAARQAWAHVGVVDALRGFRVAQVMRPNIPQIGEEAMLLEAIARHFDVQFGLCTFAVDAEERVTGMLTATQLDRLPKDRWGTTRVRERMLPVASIPVVTPETDLATAIELLEGETMTHLPVVEDGRLIGVLSRGRIVNLLRTEEEMRAGREAPEK